MVVDTNVLIFDTFEDSDFHEEASNGLDSLSKWNLPSIVFHELVWFFKSREIDRSRAKLKIEEFLTNEKTIFFQCTADDVRFSIARMNNYRNYNDYLILSVARRLELPLYTFDRELKKVTAKSGVKIYKGLE